MFGNESMAQLSAAINNLTNRIDILESRLNKTERPKDIEMFGQICLDIDDDFLCGTFSTSEGPFDNVRAIFDKDSKNLKYIGLIDDLPF